MKYGGISVIDAGEVLARIRINPSEAVEAAENRYRAAVGEVCDRAAETGAEVIYLCGPSAAGKTTTAKRLCAGLAERGRQVDRLSLDNFYRPIAEHPRWDDGQPDMEHIDSLDIPQYEAFVRRLAGEGSAEFREYNFNGGAAKPSFTVRWPAGGVLVIEGLHALNPRIAAPLAGRRCVKVYISTHSDFYDKGRLVLPAKCLRLERRLLRDLRHRGADVRQTLALWKYVVRGEQEYIMPFRDSADFHIDTAHDCEPFLYSQRMLRALEECGGSGLLSGEIGVIRAAAEAFPYLSTDIVPKTSLLQEFLS